MQEWTIRDVRELIWKINERAKNLDWDSERQVAKLYHDVTLLNAIIHVRRWELWEENDTSHQEEMMLRKQQEKKDADI